jgi:hypothetical protein
VLLVIALSVVLSFFAHTFLVAAAMLIGLLVIAGRFTRGAGREPLFSRPLLLHASFLLIGLVLFLGPEPFSFRKEPVAGLYDYLYNHVFGFDGIRYVSRFIVVDMLALAVIAGSGAALALRAAGKLRIPVFAVLLVLMLLELRSAPMALADLPSRNTIPAAYDWLARHKGPEPIATIPAYPMGYYGARNDYFALFHKRRTIDGKSSWMPPITHAFIFESRRFPRSSATQMLRALGAKYLVVHAEEYSPARRQRVLEWLDNRPGDYVRRFSAGDQVIYEILPTDDPSMKLLQTPGVPAGSVRVPPHQLSASASSSPERTAMAVDGKEHTRWRSKRFQSTKEWVELSFKKTRTVTALEMSPFREPFEAPSAFRLSVRDSLGQWKAVVTRPDLQIYSDQVFRPRSFLFRVVLPQPIRTDGLRVELLDGVARRRWSIYEAVVWALPR